MVIEDPSIALFNLSSSSAPFHVSEEMQKGSNIHRQVKGKVRANTSQSHHCGDGTQSHRVRWDGLD